MGINLKKLLGLETDDDRLAQQAGLTDEEMSKLRERQSLDSLGLEPAPPSKEAAYVNAEKGISYAPDLGAAESMAGVEKDVRSRRGVDDAVRGATDLLDQAARGEARGLDMHPTSPADEARFERDAKDELHPTSPSDNARFTVDAALGKYRDSSRDDMLRAADESEAASKKGFDSPPVELTDAQKSEMFALLDRAGIKRDKGPPDDYLSPMRRPSDGTQPFVPGTARASRPPGGGGATAEEKAALADAFKRAGVNPEEGAPEGEAVAQAEPAAAAPEALKRRPLGVVGPEALPERPNAPQAQGGDEAAYRAQLTDPSRRIFSDDRQAAAGAGGAGSRGGANPMRDLVGKLATSSNPEMADLKKRLALREQRLRLADAAREAGIGADIAGGTHYNTDAGKGMRDLAEATVDSSLVPMEQRRKEGRFESEQLNDAQNRVLHQNQDERAGSAEQRAISGENRANVEEGRKARAFETVAAESDATSQTSANARATAAGIYPKAWNSIPADVREKFSAKDVGRIFGEVSMKDYAAGGGGSKSAGIDERQYRAMANAAKLPNAGKVLDLNDALATLEAGKAPGTGYVMNKDGWQNFLRTPDGVAFKQKVQAIINKHIKDTTGLVVRESEEGRIMGELGYGSWDDAQALDSGLHKMQEEVQADLDQTLNKLPPRSKQLLEQQGAVPKVGGRYGKVIKGSTRNYGSDDTFNPRELIRKVLGRDDRDPTWGSNPDTLR